jgi:RHS repeat-associated protein
MPHGSASRRSVTDAAAAAPSGACIARASRRSGERLNDQIAFQLTDAQFSVIAVATPGKPGVVIDRIAYSAYGEATRTLRSDVNGDGFVNKDDYNGVIRSRLNATIGSAGYVVEADLDRDGKVAQSDYDIAIADDGKSSSGGVGEAGLFAKGVRNGVGYCGYIFNDESGLYTVRFRTYSPTLGRWLERDPAGYVDGMGLYEYVRGGPITAMNPWGLCACDDGKIRPERYDDDHPDRERFEEGRPQDRDNGKEHLVPEELKNGKYKKPWHDHLARATEEWKRKTKAKRGEKHLPEGEMARQILEFAEENNIRLSEETFDRLKRISSVFAFASSLLLVEQVMAEIRSAEAAVGDPENPCGNFIRTLAEQKASLDCGGGCNEERFSAASRKCRAWLEEKLLSPGGELMKSELYKNGLVDQIKTLTERLAFECSAADSALKAEKARAAARRGGGPR